MRAGKLNDKCENMMDNGTKNLKKELQILLNRYKANSDDPIAIEARAHCIRTISNILKVF